MNFLYQTFESEKIEDLERTLTAIFGKPDGAKAAGKSSARTAGRQRGFVKAPMPAKKYNVINLDDIGSQGDIDRVLGAKTKGQTGKGVRK